MLAAAGIGVAATWVGIVLAYDSYDWPPAGHGWPVSFFVVTLVFVVYLLSGLGERATGGVPRARPRAGPVPPAPGACSAAAPAVES